MIRSFIFHIKLYFFGFFNVRFFRALQYDCKMFLKVDF